MSTKQRRLQKLAIYYPDRPKPVITKPTRTFVKPGVSASIPSGISELPAVRYLKAASIRDDIEYLNTSIKDLEADTEFIADTMADALLVPQAIEYTIDRIHGQIYEIEREIDYNGSSSDDAVKKIQKVYRGFEQRQHYRSISEALESTIRRDCAPMHHALLGFLVSYSKNDDEIKMRLNRRFIGRNREALRYWRQWSIQSNQLLTNQKKQLLDLQDLWIKRIVVDFLKKWKEISFSQHSRKAVAKLQQQIAAEARQRLADQQTDVSGESILELLAAEREQVIIDFGLRNKDKHLISLVFRMWKAFVDICRKDSRSGNALARTFYTTRMRKSFFQAWYSLSVGRIVVFGGYSDWHRPVNARKQKYRENFDIELKVLKSWRWLCIQRKQWMAQRDITNQRFKLRVFRAYHQAAVDKREKMAKLIETYIQVLRHRTHKVFTAWHHYVSCEQVRRQPTQFLLKKQKSVKLFHSKRVFFFRWVSKFRLLAAKRMEEEADVIEKYSREWKAAGDEMHGSLFLIQQLNERLRAEYDRRIEDLSKTQTRVQFLKAEQDALAFAMRSVYKEIGNLQQTISKSTMRFFIDVRPIHEKVVLDVPGALERYKRMKEEEKRRAEEEKKAAEKAITAPQQAPNPKPNNRRRRTMMPTRSKGIDKQGSRGNNRLRRSIEPEANLMDIQEEEGN